ncbi:MAG: hypothetical protein L0Z55_03620 [Planctomycetes bacterium]|nr:hypothetical protein [Planctomycetota bacterium]
MKSAAFGTVFGALLAVAASYFVTQKLIESSQGARTAREPDTLAETLQRLDDRLAKVEASIGSMGGEVASLRQETAAAREAVAGVQAAGEAAGGGVVERASFASGRGDAAAGAKTSTVSAPELEKFKGLLARFFDGEGEGSLSTDEQEQFWKLARTTDALEQVIDGLKNEVAADPRSTEPRMELAESYIAKLLTVPDGPERGVWSVRAEEQWREVVNLEPTHWRANFSLGINFSYYPPFLNKTGEAIEWLERSRALLADEPVQDDQVRNYTVLAGLYQRQGESARAREVLAAGLARHPDSEEIDGALKRLPAAPAAPAAEGSEK